MLGFPDNPLPEHIQMLEALLDGLMARAQTVCNNYWTERIRQESNPIAAKSIVGTRIRQSESGGVSCEWYFNEFRRDGKGNTKVFSKNIPLKKDNSGGVNLKQLKSKAKQWEYPLLVYTEMEYIKLRLMSKRLVKLKQANKQASDAYDQFLNNK
jgi:hypothetical protein